MDDDLNASERLLVECFDEVKDELNSKLDAVFLQITEHELAGMMIAMTGSAEAAIQAAEFALGTNRTMTALWGRPLVMSLLRNAAGRTGAPS